MPLNLPPFKQVNDWLNYISQIHHREMDFTLDRIQQVVNPTRWNHFNCPVIIVGGTNGKGSCVKFLESIFTAAGYRSGAYTSPHLMVFNERIRVNAKLVEDAALLHAFAAVEQARGEISLSYFEFTFLAALKIFQDSPLDVVILEVGLGGRLDAVNIVDADIAVITTIDLDHTDLLGPDRESIAREKAGIFRRHQPVVCGDPNPPDALRQRAAELDSPWYGIDETFHYAFEQALAGWRWQGKQFHYECLPALSLKHQNAATSLMVVELLQPRLPVPETAIRQGLAQASLPGRFEKMSAPGGGYCYLDVAHNPQGARWLAEQWQKVAVRGKKIAVFAMLSDKDIAETVRSLLHYVDSWYVATLSVPRGATAQHLQAVLSAQGARSCYSFATVEHALQAAIAGANMESDSILIFGSFYTVAAARNYLSALLLNY
jgi:dihydrofolate synthase / folylpolyglutamate synthase